MKNTVLMWECWKGTSHVTSITTILLYHGLGVKSKAQHFACVCVCVCVCVRVYVATYVAADPIKL